MVMYIVIPTRRSTATAVQMFAASAFGDAGITYFLGLISKALKKNFEQDATVCPGSEKEQWNFFHPYRYFYNNYGLNTDFGDTADVDQNTLEAEEDCIKEVVFKFRSLQWTLFITIVIQVIGAVFFFIASVYIVKE